MALGAFNSPGILMTWPAPIVLFNGSFVVAPEKKEPARRKEENKSRQHIHGLTGAPEQWGKFLVRRVWTRAEEGEDTTIEAKTIETNKSIMARMEQKAHKV